MRLQQRSALHCRLIRVATVAVAAACGGRDIMPPQNVLSLEGVVRNGNSNAPIEGAIVWTGSYSGNVFVSRRISGTNAAGQYSIDDECLGNDYLKAQAPGFRDVIGPVDCAPTRRTIDIALIPVFNP